MAPLKPVKKGPADQRVQLVLKLAVTISQLLKDRSPITTNTVNELATFVKQPFPAPNAVALARKSVEFDAQGSLLWNAATKIIRGDAIDDNDFTRFGVLLRAFAFLLLDAAHNASSQRTKDTDQRLRVFKLALKAARGALDSHDLEMGAKLLESCSQYASTWDDADPIIRVTNSEVDGAELIRQLTSEFHLLLMVHAARSGRLDLAEHFFIKADVSGHEDERQHNSAELAAELCYDIGRTLQHGKNVPSALLWLERAYQLLQTNDLNSSSIENEDLRLAIVASHVGASAEQSNTESTQRSWDMVAGLEKDYGLGNRMAVLAMQLNVLMRRPSDADHISSIVFRMISSSVLTEQTFRTILHSIKKVKKASFETAVRALEQLISTRLLPDLDAVMDNGQVKAWLEKTIVTYTNFCTSAIKEDKPGVLEMMPRLFDHMVQQASDLLSPRATHAMQALVWKASNDAVRLHAEMWLNILQHPLFVNVGVTNKVRISRKAMMASLEREDLDTARAVFHQMPMLAQNDGMTRYLAYKLALRSHDNELARECLTVLVKQVDKDQRYLYACVLDAQQSGDRTMAVAAFQALVDQPSKGVQLPALLRCTARLLMEELENLTNKTLDEVTSELVRLFETAASNTKSFRQGTEEQWRAEVQWWSKNSFNISLRLCAEMHPDHLARLLQACIKFLECLPDDNDLMHRDDLAQRKHICHFLCASASIVLGRSTTDRPQQLQHYLEVQREAGAFLTAWQQPHHQVTDAEIKCARAFEMLILNVESVFKLEQWDSLDTALAACLEFEDAVRWDTLADLVMIIYEQTSNLPIDTSATARVPALLQKIINETWTADKDILKLSRWLRFTFSIALNGDDHRNDKSDETMGIKLVEQAASLARRGTEQKNEPYPEDELQWLATTAFNRAVDLLMARIHNGHDEEGEDRPTAWMQAALELARYADDNGSLHAQLTRAREEAERRMRQ